MWDAHSAKHLDIECNAKSLKKNTENCDTEGAQIDSERKQDARPVRVGGGADVLS